VVVQEGWFRGAVPTLLGAPCMLRAPVISIGVLPYMGSSKDIIAYEPDQGPITSPEGREKAKAISEYIAKVTWRAEREFCWVLEGLNVPEDVEIPQLQDVVKPRADFSKCVFPASSFHALAGQQTSTLPVVFPLWRRIPGLNGHSGETRSCQMLDRRISLLSRRVL
jgi:hypothetical protein